MYNHTKSHNSRFSGRSRSGNRNGGNRRSFSKSSSSINPSLYVKKAVDQEVQKEFVPEHRFTDFGLDETIVAQINRRGFTTPTKIQDGAIPQVMAGHDVIGLADTGTGKTAAFLLPLLNKILKNPDEKVLIIVPTRELAVQINDELRAFSEGMRIYSALCVGGSGFQNQLRALQRRPQFIIGTPGRLNDHVRRKTLQLGNVTNLVLDEADRLVDMGFIKDVRILASQLPEKRQSLFFSATLAPEVKGLIDSFLRNPQTISVKSGDTSKNVDQDVVRYTDAFHKFSLLHDLLIQEEFKKVLIFGRTKHGVEKLHESLQERGFKSVSIHGNKSQGQRQRALNDFKQNYAQIMVATDVAARGLDIPLVTHVINFEVPDNYADYIHRIGRTGRANNQGKALTFVQ
jgi:ATP-dependent RNA helicase RhlE